MAIANVQRRRNIAGHLRQISVAHVVFAANGDTWAVPGIKEIKSIAFMPIGTIQSAANHRLVYAGNVITAYWSSWSGGTAGTFHGSVFGL